MASPNIQASQLTPDERRQIDDLGYLILPKLLSAAEVDQCLQRLEELGREHPPKKGTHHISFLSDREPMFSLAWVKPRLLAAAQQIIQEEFCFTSDEYRAPQPGGGQQGMHADAWQLTNGPPFDFASVIVPLVDFTKDNGPTRVVPGTHKAGKMPPKHDSTRAFPGEILLLGKAGDAMIFNGQLWHSGTLNRSNEVRHSLHFGYVRRSVRSRFHHEQVDRQRLLSGLDEDVKWLLRP